MNLRVHWDGLLIIAGVLLSWATLIGFLDQVWWVFELACHFRVQYFLCLILIAALLISLHKPYWATCFTGFAVINLALIIPFYGGNGHSFERRIKTFRVLSLNLNSQNEEYARVLQTIEHFNADFVVLLEVTPKWLRELINLKKHYVNFITEPRDDNFGIALFSRFPFKKQKILHIGDKQLPSVMAEVNTDSGLFSLFATHPLPPVSRQYSRLRNQQLTEIARLLKGYFKPVILAGDLNVSPWSHYFRQFLARSGLKDSSQGYGVMPTWPVDNPLFWTPIDHVLYSKKIVIKNKQIGPDVGSDHYPVIVDFKLRRESLRPAPGLLPEPAGTTRSVQGSGR